jgi:hypothetical protein
VTPRTLFLALALASLAPSTSPGASWDAEAVEVWQDAQGRWFSNVPVQEDVPMGRAATVLEEDRVEFNDQDLTEEERRYVFREAMRRQRHDGKRSVRGLWDGRAGAWRDIHWELTPIEARRFLAWREDGAPGDSWVVDRQAEARAGEWLRGDAEVEVRDPKAGFGLGDL